MVTTCKGAHQVGKASRDKGKRGERAWARLLTACGFPSRRGQQFAGGNESPDVVTPSQPGIHWEVKAVDNNTNLHAWMNQALEDKGDNQIPVIAYKKSQRKWLVVLDAHDFLAIVGSHVETDFANLTKDLLDSKLKDVSLLEEDDV